jgi:DNA-binding transcriptional ArsR family regulator
MTRYKEWVMLPTGWIREGKLTSFRWAAGLGSANTAALMSLTAIAHATDDEGASKLTYDQLCLVAGLSRAKLSQALTILEAQSLIERCHRGRSTFRLVGLNRAGGWGKLPAKGLYSGDVISAFKDFKLRNVAELDALKIYLLIVAFRDNVTNLSRLSYDKILELSGIDRARIRTALSVLTYTGLVHTERFASTTNQLGVSSAYRLVGIDSYKHGGTTGRSADFGDMIAEATQR